MLIPPHAAVPLASLLCYTARDVHAGGTKSIFATLDLLLQHLDETHATFR
jgi:hypothetical protein